MDDLIHSDGGCICGHDAGSDDWSMCKSNCRDELSDYDGVTDQEWAKYEVANRGM